MAQALTSLLFLLLLLLPFAVHARPNSLAESLCAATMSPRLCESALASDPRSAQAKDAASVIGIMIDAAARNASGARARVGELARAADAGAGAGASGLERCECLYGSAERGLEEARREYGAGRLEAAREAVGDVLAYPVECEAAMRERKEMTEWNKAVLEHCYVLVQLMGMNNHG